MRKHSTVLTQIFLQIHSKQRFRLKIYMYIRSLLSKTCSSGIVFGQFNQIYLCTFKNLTIFNVFSYLRHVKRLGICLPRGRSRSIINIHEIVTSHWRIERCHRRRASGVRVKCDAGHTSLSKALVAIYILFINKTCNGKCCAFELLQYHLTLKNESQIHPLPTNNMDRIRHRAIS